MPMAYPKKRKQRNYYCTSFDGLPVAKSAKVVVAARRTSHRPHRFRFVITRHP